VFCGFFLNISILQRAQYLFLWGSKKGTKNKRKKKEKEKEMASGTWGGGKIRRKIICLKIQRGCTAAVGL